MFCEDGNVDVVYEWHRDSFDAVLLKFKCSLLFCWTFLLFIFLLLHFSWIMRHWTLSYSLFLYNFLFRIFPLCCFFCCCFSFSFFVLFSYFYNLETLLSLLLVLLAAIRLFFLSLADNKQHHFAQCLPCLCLCLWV